MTDHAVLGGACATDRGEGAVATSLNLKAGARYEITLQGAQRWVRIARLVSVLPEVLVLELDDGRQVRVPRAAIISARPLAGSGPASRGGDLTPSRRSSQNAPGRTVSPPVNPESFYFTYI